LKESQLHKNNSTHRESYLGSLSVSITK